MIDYRLAVWNRVTEDSVQGFMHDTDNIDETVNGCCVVSTHADSRRIDALVEAGAKQVLLGDSALQDTDLVHDAVARHGGDRIGVWLPVRRASMNWGFDTTSNADFSTVTVTNPVPRWLILRADGELTDIDACWWAGQMIDAGCKMVLVTVDHPEDDDLYACVDMVASAGESFWLDANSDNTEELRFWLRYGHARRLVLPTGCDLDAIRSELDQQLAKHDEVSSCIA